MSGRTRAALAPQVLSPAALAGRGSSPGPGRDAQRRVVAKLERRADNPR